MGLGDVLYKTFVQRNSIYVATIIVGAFVGERMVNSVGDGLWESKNQGKLFKHMVADKA